MGEDLRASGWEFPAVRHGFAAESRPVAPGLHLVRVRQVHGASYVVADSRTVSPAGDADALLTSRPGVAVAIATADCVPLLLAAPADGVVAAVHAGWRGTLAAIAEVTVRAMGELGVAPERIVAALGPSIDGCCYEVERALATRFADRFGSAAWDAWRDGAASKGYLDLRRMNALVLVDAGVPAAAVQRVGPCTYCGGGPFASYRRTGADAGRQLSWIGLAAAEPGS
jgi:YfiH family protein